jgi:uncharacterized coiled-coil protein SlyX
MSSIQVYVENNDAMTPTRKLRGKMENKMEKAALSPIRVQNGVKTTTTATTTAATTPAKDHSSTPAGAIAATAAAAPVSSSKKRESSAASLTPCAEIKKLKVQVNDVRELNGKLMTYIGDYRATLSEQEKKLTEQGEKMAVQEQKLNDLSAHIATQSQAIKEMKEKSDMTHLQLFYYMTMSIKLSMPAEEEGRVDRPSVSELYEELMTSEILPQDQWNSWIQKKLGK